MFTTVRHLSVYMSYRERGFLCDMDDAEWVEVLRVFPAVETLHIGGELALLIDPVLDRLTSELITEVLPALRFLNLSGQPTGSILWLIISARQLTGFPLTIIKTREEFRALESRYETEDVVLSHGD